jgi:hypothetical protein
VYRLEAVDYGQVVKIRVKPLDEQYKKVVLNPKYGTELLMKLVESAGENLRCSLNNKIALATTDKEDWLVRVSKMLRVIK